jgi:hypothetical protein
MSEFLNFIGPWACVAVIFGVPVALAWWLSDGLAGIEISSSGSRIAAVPNPYTNKAGLAIVSNATGLPLAYLS